MARVAVIGAGIMGLAAAWQALQSGHDVDVYEAAPEAGGMAAHFMLGDLSTERFYHFVCKTDEPIFRLMNALGIGDRMRWVETSMGQFTHGHLHRWGDPIALLRFPDLGLIDKLRYGFMVFISTRRNRWSSLEHRNARDWIIAWCGKRGYALLWQKLFDLKFYEYAGDVSAAWIWTRIRRTGRSRRSLLQEELGYIEGGSETLIRALTDAIRLAGGRLHLATPVRQVISQDGRVTGVVLPDGERPADAVISTVPTPLVPRMIPGLPEAALAGYRSIVNIGVVCVVLRLSRSVSPHFWVNVNDARFDIPGIIEFSNLRPVGDAVVYVPFYMPATHPRWNWTDDQFIEESMACLHALNPAVTRADLLSSHVGRLSHAQPICTTGFAARLPPVQTAIAGLQVADTCFYYPEDRGIAESIRLGLRMADAVGQAAPLAQSADPDPHP